MFNPPRVASKAIQINFFKSVSTTLILCLLFQDFSYANPEVFKLSVPKNLEWAKKFLPDLPESFVKIEDAHHVLQAPDSSNKTLILIQDPHTNFSGQKNIAKTLEVLLREGSIDTVFVEAGFGDVSLESLKGADADKRQLTGLKYLRAGELSGPEFLSLTSEKDFTLWGVEDESLYWESLETYRAIVGQRQKFQEYLEKAGNTARILKSRTFNPFLLGFDEKHEDFLKEKLSTADYFLVLLDRARALNLDVSRFPNLESLKRLSQKESRIDFKNPDLKLYSEYLKEAESLKAPKLLEEQKLLETAVYKALIQTPDEEKLHKAALSLRNLKALLNLTLTPDEFRAYEENPGNFDITQMTGFLNRRIMELRDSYDKAIFLEEGYEEILQKCRTFYDLTRKRDEVFIERALKAMDERNLQKAALVTGGYHSPNLKTLLKSKNISYVSVTPQVLQETNHRRYEELLLSQKSTGNPAPADKIALVAAASRLAGSRLATLPQLAHELGTTPQAPLAPNENVSAARLANSETGDLKSDSDKDDEKYYSIIAEWVAYILKNKTSRFNNSKLIFVGGAAKRGYEAAIRLAPHFGTSPEDIFYLERPRRYSANISARVLEQQGFFRDERPALILDTMAGETGVTIEQIFKAIHSRQSEAQIKVYMLAGIDRAGFDEEHPERREEIRYAALFLEKNNWMRRDLRPRTFVNYEETKGKLAPIYLEHADVKRLLGDLNGLDIFSRELNILGPSKRTLEIARQWLRQEGVNPTFGYQVGLGAQKLRELVEANPPDGLSSQQLLFEKAVANIVSSGSWLALAGGFSQIQYPHLFEVVKIFRDVSVEVDKQGTPLLKEPIQKLVKLFDFDYLVKARQELSSFYGKPFFQFDSTVNDYAEWALFESLEEALQQKAKAYRGPRNNLRGVAMDANVGNLLPREFIRTATSDPEDLNALRHIANPKNNHNPVNRRAAGEKLMELHGSGARLADFEATLEGIKRGIADAVSSQSIFKEFQRIVFNSSGDAYGIYSNPYQLYSDRNFSPIFSRLAEIPSVIMIQDERLISTLVPYFRDTYEAQIRPLLSQWRSGWSAALPNANSWLSLGTMFYMPDNYVRFYRQSLKALSIILGARDLAVRYSFFGPHLRANNDESDFPDKEWGEVMLKKIVHSSEFKANDLDAQGMIAAVINGLMYQDDVAFSSLSRAEISKEEARRWIPIFLNYMGANPGQPESFLRLARFLGFKRGVISADNVKLIAEYNEKHGTNIGIQDVAFGTKASDRFYEEYNQVKFMPQTVRLNPLFYPGYHLFLHFAKHVGYDTAGWPTAARLASPTDTGYHTEFINDPDRYKEMAEKVRQAYKKMESGETKSIFGEVFRGLEKPLNQRFIGAALAQDNQNKIIGVMALKKPLKSALDAYGIFNDVAIIFADERAIMEPLIAVSVIAVAPEYQRQGVGPSLVRVAWDGLQGLSAEPIRYHLMNISGENTASFKSMHRAAAGGSVKIYGPLHPHYQKANYFGYLVDLFPARQKTSAESAILRKLPQLPSGEKEALALIRLVDEARARTRRIADSATQGARLAENDRFLVWRDRLREIYSRPHQGNPIDYTHLIEEISRAIVTDVVWKSGPHYSLIFTAGFYNSGIPENIQNSPAFVLGPKGGPEGGRIIRDHTQMNARHTLILAAHYMIAKSFKRSSEGKEDAFAVGDLAGLTNLITDYNRQLFIQNEGYKIYSIAQLPLNIYSLIAESLTVLFNNNVTYMNFSGQVSFLPKEIQIRTRAMRLFLKAIHLHQNHRSDEEPDLIIMHSDLVYLFEVLREESILSLERQMVETAVTRALIFLVPFLADYGKVTQIPYIEPATDIQLKLRGLIFSNRNLIDGIIARHPEIRIASKDNFLAGLSLWQGFYFANEWRMLPGRFDTPPDETLLSRTNELSSVIPPEYYNLQEGLTRTRTFVSAYDAIDYLWYYAQNPAAARLASPADESPATPPLDQPTEWPLSFSRNQNPFNWTAVFGNQHPLAVEIGPGECNVIAEAAQGVSAARNPINFVGIELSSNARAIEYRQANYKLIEGFSNVRIVEGLAHWVLKDAFAGASLDLVYSFFPSDADEKMPSSIALYSDTNPIIISALEKLKPNGQFLLVTEEEKLFRRVKNQALPLGVSVQSGEIQEILPEELRVIQSRFGVDYRKADFYYTSKIYRKPIYYLLLTKKPPAEAMAPEKVLTFIARVFKATGRTQGRLAIGGEVYAYEENEATGELTVRLSDTVKRVLSRESWTRIAGKEPKEAIELQFRAPDFKILWDNANRFADRAPMATIWDRRKTVAQIDLDALNVDSKTFEDLIVPLLLREIIVAAKRPWGEEARFILKSADAGLKERVMGQAAKISGLDKILFADRDALREEGFEGLEAILITTPGKAATHKQKRFYLQSLQAGDLPNFRALFRTSLMINRMESLEASDPQVSEIAHFLSLLLGHKINPTDLVEVVKGSDNLDKILSVAIPAIARLPIEHFFRGARLALKMSGQSA